MSEEEDYRVKNAREGRAIYVAGKSVEETKAGLAATDAWVTLTLTAAEAGQLERATEELPYLLHHAEAVFALLHSGFVNGDLDGHSGVISLMELCSRAFRHAVATEGHTIEQFDMKLRAATASATKGELAAKNAKGEGK
jgi:hypothetical protein